MILARACMRARARRYPFGSVGQAFEPEVVRQMSLALETVCGKFGMKLADEPATRVVALKIIDLAERGVRDAATLTEMALKELKHHLPFA
jgi:hypothetical protein